jgi:endonuclease/exonuclease/phosphatase (EEP) superfamily protein YafD
MRDEKKRSGWAEIAVALSLVYTAGALLFFLLWLLLPSLPPLLELVRAFTPFVFAPLIVVLPLGLVLRSRALLVTSGALLAIFVLLYAPYFLPDLSADAEGEVLTVMTFNTGLELSQPEEVLAAVREEEPDVVALLEVVEPLTERVRSDLEATYPYQVWPPGPGKIGMLSRYPIVEHELLDAVEGQRQVHVQIDREGTLIHLFVVHPPPPGLVWYRETGIPIGLRNDAPQQQVQAAVERLTEVEGPRILLGDLNMSDQTPAYREVRESLEDAYREAGLGFGFTFPHNARVKGLPIPIRLVRLDYIFHSPELEAEEAHVGCTSGSDHCYVVARLRLITER